jgi:TIR domain
MSKIFISHSSADKPKLVRRLAEDLKYVGHEVWYDEWTIQAGESLAEKIDQGIQECDYFVIVLSEAALRSRWVRQELNAAVVREIERKNVFVIPILIGAVKDNQVPISLRSKKYIDLRRLNDALYTRRFDEILRALGDVRDVGKDNVPIFSCPRCIPKEADTADGFLALSELDIICLENELQRDWHFDQEKGEALLFFEKDDLRSRELHFRLDAEDRTCIFRRNIKSLGWFFYKAPENKNSIIKLQYQIGRKKIVSLYWINYAMEQYILSCAREFSHDWDFEVTLGRKH